MHLFIVAIFLIFSGGILSFTFSRRRSLSAILGSSFCVTGSLLASWPVFLALSGTAVDSIVLELPLGPATLCLDAVSAFFAIPVLLIGSLSAIFSAATVRNEKYMKGGYWFFFNLLVAAMLLLLCSANAFVFLTAWELMSVAAFFLITHRDELSTARNAGWRFLVASHIGTAALLFMFALLGSGSGSLEFAKFSAGNLPEGMGSIIFFAALFGFGVKVGLLPLHVWLPDSYAYADAPVSAILSAAMSKMGFYGLLRVIMFLPSFMESWGWAMAIGGLFTGIFALITGMAQSDLKKVIAYSSMENAGIILMALGTFVLAVSWQQPLIAFAALAGALFHVINHSVCKGLLFFGSGAVFYGVGNRKVELMGGLAEQMPFTAITFGLASAAIAGLPPFNSFVSEFIIFLAGMKVATIGNASGLLLAVVVLAGLGLIGGLAAACFARTFGLVFLGASRSEKKHTPEDVHGLVRLPMIILSIILVLTAFLSPWLINVVATVATAIAIPAGMTFADGVELAYVVAPLKMIACFSFGLFVLVILGWHLRNRFFSKGDVFDRGTWDCGYASPDPRIQYTSSSFSQPVVEAFSSVIRPYQFGEKVNGLFPQRASFRTDSPDSVLRYLFFPLFALINRILIPIRAFQHGRLHLYIFYIAFTLLALLVWKVVTL